MADRLLCLSLADEDDAPVPEDVFPPELENLVRAASGVHHQDENVTQRLPSLIDNRLLDFRTEYLMPLSLFKEWNRRKLSEQAPLLRLGQHPPERPQGAVLP
jgi:hypothetical protein